MTSKDRQIFLGDGVYHHEQRDVKGEYVNLLGEKYYCIRNYDRMPPFFMSLVSCSDQWMFISSTGGLSAGRRNADSALFPYYPDDRISENAGNTGHKAIFLITRGDSTYLWEPFGSRSRDTYRVCRNLYKNVYGNKLVFEEINHDLALTFRYAWRTSNRFGFVKTSWLSNDSKGRCSISLVDGLQNILPHGVTAPTQSFLSNLLDAYKRNELDAATGVGIFSLSSSPTDLAEASESLKATTVWQTGLERVRHLLSSQQLERFARGERVVQETDIRGHRGAYLVNAEFALVGGEERTWSIVAEIGQGSCETVAIINALRDQRDALATQLESDIKASTEELVSLVANADGVQLSADELCTAHHFSNVLFNVMRGGVFADNNSVSKADLVDFVKTRNKGLTKSHQLFFGNLPDKLEIGDLAKRAAETQSADLQRLCYEYLPLTFSRRHGDPSRPWNQFSINLRNPDGSRRLDYEGNWRDIFQNWESLAYSYPEFIEGMICKFLNAMTADGYNPYRVTRDGIEWDVPSPSHPWANIGYWSDHQIIYLQRLLEIFAKFHPARLETLLTHKIFSYANVPYRIKPYEALLANWHDTIVFDDAADQEITDIVSSMGTDGKLVLDQDGRVFHVSMAEKLLVPVLVKLSNLVPEGGIWMNTQRPEWNDANNALVGKGLSVVTACYLRRHIAFLRDLLVRSGLREVELTREAEHFYADVYEALKSHKDLLDTGFDDRERRAVMDALGQAGSKYRLQFYESGFSGKFTELQVKSLLRGLELAQRFVEQTVSASARGDRLYHAYNLLQIDSDTASIRHLYEMLEGQVAILSSGLLSSEQSLELLRALRGSKMYRADQHSYMLYPDRALPGFLGKNCLSSSQIQDSALIMTLIEEGNSPLMSKDEDGVYHFNCCFRNARDVRQALDTMRETDRYRQLVDEEADFVLELFDDVFKHSEFTGRSGRFFAYEGLGSIYWHMVSKLLLAVQEVFFRALEEGATHETCQSLAEAYLDIRQGIGFNKAPDLYGAFPTDPYSHTPAGQGAKQPGMTGQVKEEIITRMGELGVLVKEGRLSFRPVLLRRQEYTSAPTTFEYIDAHGQSRSLQLPANALAYTFCQVPVVYVEDAARKIEVHYTNGRLHEVAGRDLDLETSQLLYSRDGKIEHVTVYVGTSERSGESEDDAT